jgi:membrane peptidoglycan carboxypeptidase
VEARSIATQGAEVAEQGGRPAQPRRRRRARALLIALGAAGCLGVLVLLAGVALLTSLPGVSDAQDRTQAILESNRAVSVGVPPPTRLAASIVAVEDQRFYAHHGIDLPSVARVAWAGVTRSGWQAQGGSTITQQLAKRLYTGDQGGWTLKPRQIGLAVKLEQRYTKSQILEMYLDSVYFGSGHWGAVQASQGYFHKPPRDLTWGEASLLAGLVQAPSLYDPHVHLAGAQQRQHHVLDRLVATGLLSRQQALDAARGLESEAGELGFGTE